jgi:hypothetical protein
MSDKKWIEALKQQGIHATVRKGKIVFKHIVLGERKKHAA